MIILAVTAAVSSALCYLVRGRQIAATVSDTPARLAAWTAAYQALALLSFGSVMLPAGPDCLLPFLAAVVGASVGAVLERSCR